MVNPSAVAINIGGVEKSSKSKLINGMVPKGSFLMELYSLMRETIEVFVVTR